jgi:hypothetical protein
LESGGRICLFLPYQRTPQGPHSGWRPRPLKRKQRMAKSRNPRRLYSHGSKGGLAFKRKELGPQEEGFVSSLSCLVVCL